MINTIQLPPFKRMCVTIGNLPSSFMESMSYYEALCWLTNYLANDVVPAVNTNSEALTELQTYVATYFDNLDVQEEINNKLDDMAESGELTEIIAQYLQLAGVLAFDTVTAMKAAENLVDGSITRTLGESTYLDGKGAFYKIRTLINTDVIDEINIISLTNYPTLIAELIPNYDINQINKRLTIMNNKKVIVIGDSYSHQEFEDITAFWWQTFASYLGLTLNSSLYVNASDGGGFYNDHFYNRLYELRNIADADMVTDILVVGGLNDRGKNKSDLYTKMSNFKTLAATYFPNAKISLAYVGNTNPAIRQSTENRVGVIQSIMYYQENAGKLNFKFLKNTQYILHNYKSTYWQDDGAHPSQLGQDMLAIYLANAFINGYCNVELFDTDSYSTLAASGRATAVSNTQFITGISNEYSYLKKAGDDNIYFTMDANSINCNGTTPIEIGTLTGTYFAGNGTPAGIMTPIIVTGTIGGTSNVRAIGMGYLYMEYGKLYLTPQVFYNNASVNTSLQYIYIPAIMINVPSYYA